MRRRVAEDNDAVDGADRGAGDQPRVLPALLQRLVDAALAGAESIAAAEQDRE